MLRHKTFTKQVFTMLVTAEDNPPPPPPTQLPTCLPLNKRCAAGPIRSA